ncbi:hypothetical protein HELRODRAFT_166977 [Helobdella robusta]|uniref:Uncharacterized protein n=1 Tax=Helobdella robusta TaxID=6412 RepID=T1EYU3_HELRO|nr:hypothetical protein HELRODRAFT_166977 [Helobdella robusta]ESO11888.1 hypothetical protein HELRODRAFT_166977 [Helobdella robusta]
MDKKVNIKAKRSDTTFYKRIRRRTQNKQFLKTIRQKLRKYLVELPGEENVAPIEKMDSRDGWNEGVDEEEEAKVHVLFGYHLHISLSTIQADTFSMLVQPFLLLVCNDIRADGTSNSHKM